MGLRSRFARPWLGFDLLRVYLGIGLTVRGAMIATDPALLDQFIDNERWLVPMFTAHAVVLVHVVGGMLLALGCGTRLAALVQIPPVATALFLLHWHEGLFSRSQSLELAALVLVALVLYAMFGAGRFSIDWVVARARAKGDTGEPRPALLTDLDWHPEPRTPESPAAPPSSASSSQLQPTESPLATATYRDVKLELMLVVVVFCVLFALLISGLYVAAAVWLIIAMVMFGVWRIGRAPFG